MNILHINKISQNSSFSKVTRNCGKSRFDSQEGDWFFSSSRPDLLRGTQGKSWTKCETYRSTTISLQGKYSLYLNVSI